MNTHSIAVPKVSLKELRAVRAVFAMYRGVDPVFGSAAAWADRPWNVTFLEMKPLWEPRMVIVPSFPDRRAWR